MSPSAPRTEQGLYWGYSVRLAASFGAVFTQSPYDEGYDITMGTSERGTSIDDLELPNFRYSVKNVTTVKPLLTDSCTIRTSLFYEQLTWCETKSIKTLNLCNTGTLLFPFKYISVLKRFSCNKKSHPDLKWHHFSHACDVKMWGLQF